MKNIDAVRLIWATDVHLPEASSEAIDAFMASLREVGADVFVLTGDIGTARTLRSSLERIHDSFPGEFCFVLGNHDYYGGTVSQVREEVSRICADLPRAHFLTTKGPVVLSSDTALVGVDGWGDARYGEWSRTSVSIRDFEMINDIKWSRMVRSLFVDKLRSLGDDSANRLRRQLEQVLPFCNNVLVATHVPPFWEAAWLPEGKRVMTDYRSSLSEDDALLREGAHCEPDWVPFFACKAVGDVLLEFADANPHCSFSVLCGHTHGGGEVSVRPNLHVVTGAAVYGAPKIQGEIVIGQGRELEKSGAVRRI